MINFDQKNTGSEHRGTGMHNFDKQTTTTTKKVAPKDVQNANKNLMCNYQEGSHFMERRPITDTFKVYGTKRFTPQPPSIHPFDPTLSNNAAKEHLTHARNKLAFELGHERIQNSRANYTSGSELRPFKNMQQKIPRKPTQIRNNNLNYVSAVTPNHMAPPPSMTLSYLPPSLPSSLGKPNNGFGAAECDRLKVFSETPHFANAKKADDRQWEERNINLQNSLKRCDELDNSDLLRKLRQLSPAELSMYTFELEKKAIELAVEEGKEMQRMKALNIFGISPTTMDPLQMTELPRSMN